MEVRELVRVEGVEIPQAREVQVLHPVQAHILLLTYELLQELPIFNLLFLVLSDSILHEAKAHEFVHLLPRVFLVDHPQCVVLTFGTGLAREVFVLDRASLLCLGLVFGSPKHGYLELLVQLLQKILLRKERGFVEEVNWVALGPLGSATGLGCLRILCQLEDQPLDVGRGRVLCYQALYFSITDLRGLTFEDLVDALLSNRRLRARRGLSSLHHLR